jgi:hypothetical protein
MRVEDFKGADEHFMKQVNHVLDGKGRHYTMGDDRFSNFKEAAALAGGITTHLDEALASMRKHVIAFFNMFTRYDGEKVPQGKFMEHGGDIINYIRLINGILLEGDEDVYVACDLTDCNCHHPGEGCKKDT